MATRIEKFIGKWTGNRCKEVVDLLKPSVDAEMALIQAQLIDLEARARAVLAGEAVVTSDYPKYHTFVRQIFSLQRHFGGGSGLIEEVALLVAKFKARGCLEPVLNKLRDEIFAIPAPGAP